MTDNQPPVDDPSAVERLSRRRGTAAGVVIVLVAFAGIYVRRMTHGYPNVDDYLYALQTKGYLTGLRAGPRALASSWRLFGTSSPLVPMTALPIAAFSSSPGALVAVQVLPVLGLFAASLSLLRQLRPTARGSWAGAAAIACLPPVLGNAAMFHFAVAATACSLGALAAYLRSARMRVRKPCLAFGLLIGLLSISRVIAPVYVAALLLPVAVDMFCDRSDARARLRGSALAASVALVVAAPWWLLTGRTAIDYLTGAGYDPASGFAIRRSPLQLLSDRLVHTADETGVVLAGLLVGLVLLVLVRAARKADRPVLLSVSVVLLGMAALSTSSNLGTAFALPFVALGGVVALSALTTPRLLAGLAVAMAASVILLPRPLILGGHVMWLSGTPGEGQLIDALGCDCRSFTSAALNREVISHLSGVTSTVRDDAVLNVQSLRAFDAQLQLVTPDYGSGSLAGAAFDGVQSVIAGSTPRAYHSQIDFDALRTVLTDAGFTLTWQRRLSPSNDIAVWRR